MAVINNGRKVTVRDVKIIEKDQKNNIYYYFLGCVYSSINNGKKKFCCSDFVGDKNYYWEGTPIFSLYEAYQKKYKRKYSNLSDEAINKKAYYEAGKEAGRLLLKVLIDDKKRNYEQSEPKHQNRKFNQKYYEWISDNF